MFRILAPFTVAGLVAATMASADAASDATARRTISRYQIFNPDGTFLLESGERVVEVINRGDRADYCIEITVR